MNLRTIYFVILATILGSILGLKFLNFGSIKTLANSIIPSYIGSKSSKETCFESEKLGCFKPLLIKQNGSLNAFFYAHTSAPGLIDTTFHVYSCSNRFRPTVFKWNSSVDEIRRSMKYDPDKKTIFLIHGYRDQFGEYNWNGDMKDFILNNQNKIEQSCDYNVIGVDWRRGSMLSLYHNSAANTMMVGRVVARFIKKLQYLFNQPTNDFCLVGHSLGSHISGFVGKEFQKGKLRFILGLDPAGPGFYHAKDQRLSPDDAELVVTIHTNAGDHISYDSFGIDVPLGHYSFFPNGGKIQPGCETGATNVFTNILRNRNNVVTGLTDHIACSHRRVTQIVQFNESLITTSEPMAYACTSNADFVEGKCTSCNKDHDCVPFRSWFKYWLNLKLDPDWVKPRVYFIDTAERPPYAAYLYGIHFDTGNFTQNFTGKMELILVGDKRDSEVITFNGLKNQTAILPEKSYSKLIKVNKDLGKIEAMKVRFYGPVVDKNSTKNQTATSDGLKSVQISFKQFHIQFMSSESPIIRKQESRILTVMPEKFFLDKDNIIQ